MRQMHAVDINCIVRELQALVGSRVDKAFQDGPDQIRIRFYGGKSGRAELLIEAGKRIHLTQYKRKAPELPTSFAMFLRKHLDNLPLSSLSQHDFDRIVLLRFGDLCLVVEIFAQGNVVLLDPASKVMLSLKRGAEDRVCRGRTYVFPQPPLSPFSITDPRALISALRHSDLVRSLALDLGLGKLYANEVCEATGLDKGMKPAEITENQASKILEFLQRMEQATASLKGAVIYGEKEPKEFSPFQLESMKHEKATIVGSFNEAADRYYVHAETQRARERILSSRQDLAQRLSKRLEIQTSQLEQLRSKARELRAIADIIYSNFSAISPVMDQLRGQAKLSEPLIAELLKKAGLAQAFVGYDPASRTLTLRIGGKDIQLSLRRSLGENAASIYERAKDLERRAEGAARAIAQTRLKLETSLARKMEEPMPLERRPRKPEWFEKFRWFYSSNGNLVIAGRDARSNEILVRRYLENGDIYVHADVHGAPSTAIKPLDGRIEPQTIQEACAFALIHSKAWKSGTTSGDAYWVMADQVTKRPTSGEYVAKGSFVIRGKRNYVRGIEARCGIGWLGDRFMCGPFQAVANRCPVVLEIAPGERKKSDVAREIVRRLAPRDASADLDQVIQVLPGHWLKVVESG